MNKKLIISLGLVAALSTATISAMADSIIYTDGLGRMHFLGRDAANSTGVKNNYSNSAEKDLTRKLYGESSDALDVDTSFKQHPLKNYENTFPDSRFTGKYWQKKYANEEELDETLVNTRNTVKATATATKGAVDPSNPYQYGSTILDNPATNTTKTEKKHWWNRK